MRSNPAPASPGYFPISAVAVDALDGVAGRQRGAERSSLRNACGLDLRGCGGPAITNCVALGRASSALACIVVRITRSRDNRSPRRMLAAVRCHKRWARRVVAPRLFLLYTGYDFNHRVRAAVRMNF